MHNSILPVVRFTDNEVKALLLPLWLQEINNFLFKSRQSLAEKLLGLISETQQDDIVLLNQLLLFEGTNPYNPDLLELSDLPHPMLEKLIQILLLDRHLLISIKEEKEIKSYSIYLLHLYQEKVNGSLKGLT